MSRYVNLNERGIVMRCEEVGNWNGKITTTINTNANLVQIFHRKNCPITCWQMVCF